MADGFSIMVNNVTASLSQEECRTLQYLCTDVFNNSCVEDLRGALLDFAKRNQTCQPQAGDALLMELMFRLKRFDILKKELGTNRQQVEGILQKGGVLSDYRVLMADVSDNLAEEDLQALKFLMNSTLPKERVKKATSFLDVVVELEKLDEVSCDKLDLVENCFRNIRRMDLVKRIQAYQNKGQNVPCAAPKVPKQNCSKCVQVCRQYPPNPVRQPQYFAHMLTNVKLSVPETGTQHEQTGVEEYQMNPERKGVCVLIDCVGFDGELLNQTFKRLGFAVIFHSNLCLKETQKVLEDLARHKHLQGVSSFICCLISRGTDTHLLANDSHCSGIRLEDLKHIFNPVQCPSLRGKPKLFFTQIYQTTVVQERASMYDECLETDGPLSCYAENAKGIPVSADVLWYMCITEEKLLECSGHRSVYLQALSSALLRGHERRMHILDVMTEVNNVVYSHNQENPGKTYKPQLSHTLRKKLYI
ncbi:CASP8 and FADD-like apoptosis regulator a isoform X2 [Triplophysa rosa]|uniref:CASP8 and FADD-like apoptosis regulator a n=2 Tax=Triplophysa rosa TaxID=992332 RepID=A0A9W7TAH5_TRIRA|nr:CASP8 and FADD-like apoptosis regulator a isoform X2 [Triplophysa rosa]KAI7794875.1 putative CASP8 and FADD-like apoptosis regulator a [Triplophysa rosa]